MLVVKQMQTGTSFNANEIPNQVRISPTLEFDRADIIDLWMNGGILYKPSEQFFGEADDIAKNPSHSIEFFRHQRKGVFFEKRYVGQVCDAWIEGSAIDCYNLRAPLLQHPSPASGTSSQVEAPITRIGPPANPDEEFPKF